MNTTTIVPQKTLTGTEDFFLEDLTVLRGLFDAASEFDDWDMAARAFDALLQSAWSLFTQADEVATLRCPVREPEATITPPAIYFCEVD